MKKNIKILVDIIMLICLIILMSYFTVSQQMHEILGVMTIVLFVFHIYLNKQWIKTLKKGKYNFQRYMYLMINSLLIITLAVVIASSIMISSHVFSFLSISTTQLGRHMHLASTAWFFIFVSFHIGMHFNILFHRFNQKMKSGIQKYIYRVVLLIWYVYGVIAFYNAGIYKDLFVLNEFKFFDYSMNPCLAYFQYMSMVYFLSMTLYIIVYFIIRKKYKRVDAK